MFHDDNLLSISLAPVPSPGATGQAEHAGIAEKKIAL